MHRFGVYAALAVIVVFACASQPRERLRVGTNLQPLPTDEPFSQTRKDDVPQVASAPPPPTKAPDVVYFPTPNVRVEAMLRLAELKKGEKLYDIGCGDGRIPVSAARDFGARAVCVEIDPELVERARDEADRAGVGDLVEMRHADLFDTDFSDADVITLYLLPELNQRLRPKLLSTLRPGTRIVSHAFDMGDWPPEKSVEVAGVPIYLWVVPPRPTD